MGLGRPAAEDPATAAAEYARTLPVMRNSAGKRLRDVKSVAERLSSFDFENWPLDGPRTMKWWWTKESRTGLGPVARHHE